MAGLHLAFLDDDERPESTFGSNTDQDLGVLIAKVIILFKMENQMAL